VRTWWRGKTGGLLAFVVIAGLVGGGLGWVTLAALRLEQEQVEARAEAERANKVRLALWRLDSRVFTDLAREASRPYQHYLCTPLATPDAAGPAASAVDLLELVPGPGAEGLSWMDRHFLLARKADWQSVAKLQETLARGLGLAKPPATPPAVAQTVEPSLLKGLACDDNVRQLLSTAPAPQPTNPPTDMPAAAGLAPEGNAAYFSNNDLANAPPQQKAGQKVDKDTQARYSRAQVDRGAQGQYPNSAMQAPSNAKAASPNQVLTVLGPLVPLWVSVEGDERLVVTRLVQVWEKQPHQVAQVTVLDWPALERILREEVHDLLPEVQFRPVPKGPSPNPERAMTALPVELEPGPLEVPAAEVGWSPLRIGLFLAWAAALVGLSAVGLGGWSLLNLSERRIRFVSAVTHELRTPLTTLRLYLDMLATGLVHDERQKAEYIQTLNTEADRLNRLVGNVLDFSRLENQRPRLEKTPIVLGDLLAQVHATWQARCQNADKELVIDNQAGNRRVLVTDLQLVSQVLGNLIDNACKYSRGAPDPRIWLRARVGARGQLLLEVEDRGLGVPAGDRRSIFRPFRRGHGEHATVGGVGLGLALARRWAQLLGGQLTLAAVPETGGACFCLALPCPDHPAV
jgi:signal transduction histidine kinase